MRPPQDHRPSRRRRLPGRLVILGAGVLVSTTGCSWQTISNGWLPGAPGTTSITRMTRDLWVWSWVAGLAVGVLVWGLTLWCVVRYRRRKHETGLPPQLRYNVPLEILYTLVPLFMVGVLFFYTAKDQAVIETRAAHPDVRVEVVGKQWSWDFNYLQAGVYDTGTQAREAGGTAGYSRNGLPTLYLPVGRSVELVLHSRDVIHDFWVPAFDYKKDVIPGRTNYESFTPERTGEYIGRCAELCGEYHSAMLFQVRVVTPAQYQQHLAALRAAGQTGSLPDSLNRVPKNPNLDYHEVGSAS